MGASVSDAAPAFHSRASSRPGPLRLVLCVYAASRVLYWTLGLRFDARFVDSAMQVADYDLLERAPFSTAWYLHVQPPLFNLFVGLGANLFGPWDALGFQAVYVAATVAMLVAFVRFCRDLGAGSTATAVTGCFLAASPTVAQYESLLFYTHLETVLVVVAARALQVWCLTRSGAALAGFSAAMCALALGRSLYRPLWFLALGVVLIVCCRGAPLRRGLAVAVAVPLVCGLAVGAKNAAVFGWWTTSSLEGISLHRLTEPYLTVEQRQALIADGTITDVSTDPFSCRDAHNQFTPAGPARPVAVLDRTHRRQDASLTNLNHRSALRCLQALRTESLRVLAAHPDAYLRAVGRAVPTAFYSAVPDVRTRPGSQQALEVPGRAESLLLGSARQPPSPLDSSFGSVLPMQTQWVLLLAALVVPSFLLWRTVTGSRRAAGPDTPVLAFMLYVIFTGVVLTQLTEVGENNRLIVTTWPMLLAGSCLLSTTVKQRVSEGAGR